MRQEEIPNPESATLIHSRCNDRRLSPLVRIQPEHLVSIGPAPTNEDTETALVQAQLATQLLQGSSVAASAEPLQPEATEVASVEAPPLREGQPSLEQLMARVQAYGIARERYQAYADRRWGRGWKINPHGRARAWDELERYRNDPQGYLDKIESELQLASRGRAS